MAGTHSSRNQNSSNTGTSSHGQAYSPSPSNYELVYHHHLQTALQMGQFYNSASTNEHLSTVAAVLRTNSSSSASNPLGINGSIQGGSSNPNCIGGNNGIWESPLNSSNGGGQRGGLSYGHLHHQGSGDLLPVSNGIPNEIWSTVTPGRGTGSSGTGSR